MTDVRFKGKFRLLSLLSLFSLVPQSLLLLGLEVSQALRSQMYRVLSISMFLRELLRVRIDAWSVLCLWQLGEHSFHSHLFKFHFLSPSVIKKSIYSLIKLHFRVLGNGLRPHESLKHRVWKIVHSWYCALVHHLKCNMPTVIRPKLAFMVDRVLEEVALTSSSVLFVIHRP